jgi:hypothetical protein
MGAIQKSFKAWIDKQPPGPHKLIVIGKVEVPTAGWTATLKPKLPGINPNILMLEVQKTPPTGNVNQVVMQIDVRYEERPPAAPYADVTIFDETQQFTIPVGTTQ